LIRLCPSSLTRWAARLSGSAPAGRILRNADSTVASDTDALQ
jgi:hypothetical protein